MMGFGGLEQGETMKTQQTIVQEQRGMSRDEIVELIRTGGYKPVRHINGTSFLDRRGNVVGELPKDSTELIIKYGKRLCENPFLSRETLLVQGEFYRVCRFIGFSPRETYLGTKEELKAIHKIFSRLMEAK